MNNRDQRIDRNFIERVDAVLEQLHVHENQQGHHAIQAASLGGCTSEGWSSRSFPAAASCWYPGGGEEGASWAAQREENMRPGQK